MAPGFKKTGEEGRGERQQRTVSAFYLLTACSPAMPWCLLIGDLLLPVQHIAVFNSQQGELLAFLRGVLHVFNGTPPCPPVAGTA